jgi:hypothetical protein
MMIVKKIVRRYLDIFYLKKLINKIKIALVFIFLPICMYILQTLPNFKIYEKIQNL